MAKSSSLVIDPPDGGCRAWFVMVCSFLVNGIVFSIINTFGILFVKLKEELEEAGDDDAAFKTSIVGSLAIGFVFLTSFFSGILSDRIGLRATSVLGGLIATIGLGLSSLVFKKIEWLYLTYGLLFGAGASLAYNPSLTVLGLYFKRRLGMVNGIVTAGSSVFTILLSFVNPFLLSTHGLFPCFVFLTLLSSLLVFCGLSFTPLQKPRGQNSTSSSPEPPAPSGSCIEKLIYFDNWRNKRFVVWALALPCALFGYFVPFVHLVQYAENIPMSEDTKENGERAARLMACIGVTSLIGRLIFGFVSDLPLVRRNGNRIVLQQVAFFSMGVCTMLMTVAPHVAGYQYQTLLVICSIMGLFDGCFVTLLGPIAFDLCGPRGAGQAIGCLLALFSLPMTVGPPIAGLIYDKVGSYIPAFLAAGVPPIVGSLLMIAIRFLPAPPEDLDKPDDADDEGSDAEEELLENGMWKGGSMGENSKVTKVEEEEKMLAKRSSTTG